jgi:hypothetical protein
LAADLRKKRDAAHIGKKNLYSRANNQEARWNIAFNQFNDNHTIFQYVT